MAANLIDEIKEIEARAATSVQEAQSYAAQKLNKAVADAENTVKEAKQSAVRQFREKIQAAERTAEEQARKVVSEREVGANSFYAKHKEKLPEVSAWITEEVMVRYGRG